jgi:Zn ribbon nucleic-acid-binding protein
MIHFHSNDERFCGSTKQFRQFAFDPNEVTCPKCKAQDTFTLSAEAHVYVQELERKYALR